MAFPPVLNYLLENEGAGPMLNADIVPTVATAENAETADKLSTARNITLTGGVSGSITFDGSGDVTVNCTVGDGSTVGSTSKPVYINAGTATALSATVGSGTVPTYLSSGTVTASTSTVGGAAKPVYLNSGTITACSNTVGSSTAPVYLSSGTITACGTVADATKWNGAAKTATVSSPSGGSDGDIHFQYIN